ncbi:MAG: S41 family peptidase [Acidobacteriota bacterium]
MLAATGVAADDSQVRPPSVEPLSVEQASKERVGQTLAAALGDTVRLELRLEQGAWVELEENRYGIDRYFVYPDAEGGFWVYGKDRNDQVLVRAQKSYRESVGTLDQLGAWPVVAWVTWQPTEAGLAIELVVSDDKALNRELRSKALAEGSEMAIFTPRDNYYLPPELTVDERLAGFIRLWSEVESNFAFFDQVPDLDWDQVLIEYLPKIRGAESTYAYYGHLRRMIALLQDGHTNVYGPDDLQRYTPPVRLVGVAGRAVVQRVSEPAQILDPRVREEMKAAALVPGEEVVRIDGRPIRELLEQWLYPRIASSTPQDRDLRAFPALLYGELGSRARLEVKGLDQQLRTVVLTRSGQLPRTPRQGFAHRDLGGGLVYVNLPGFGSDRTAEQFEELLPEIHRASGLMLDLRENGGGNSSVGYRIISHLIDRPIAGSAWKTRSYLPAMRAWGKEETWYMGEAGRIEPAERSFPGPVVVLVGARTFSAAEDFVVALHAAERATVVGRRTGGSTGQPLFLELPGGGRARICTKRDTYPDGRDFVGVGVIPDVEVALTVEDLATGRDAILERGLEVLRSATR